MEYRDIQKHMRYEVKTKNGEYVAIGQLESDVQPASDKMIFVIGFFRYLKTYLFCSRKITAGNADYIVTKIVTIDFDGNTFIFHGQDAVEKFVKHVAGLEGIESVTKY